MPNDGYFFIETAEGHGGRGLTSALAAYFDVVGASAKRGLMVRQIGLGAAKRKSRLLSQK